VDAIRLIGKTVGEVNEIATTIASAGEGPPPSARHVRVAGSVFC
jgi:hypothetical protein